MDLARQNEVVQQLPAAAPVCIDQPVPDAREQRGVREAVTAKRGLPEQVPCGRHIVAGFVGSVLFSHESYDDLAAPILNRLDATTPPMFGPSPLHRVRRTGIAAIAGRSRAGPGRHAAAIPA
jgi:hypothetical protein